MGHIGGITGNGIVTVILNAQIGQPLEERIRRTLAIIAGQHNTGHIEAEIPEDVDQPDHIQIIGNAQIPPDFVFLDIRGVDGNHHLHLLLQVQQHPQLAVRPEAGKHTGCVIVVIQLAAELQIELAAELGNAIPDMAGLHLQIFVVVKCPLNHE